MNLEKRIERLENVTTTGDVHDAARAFARMALEQKIGISVEDGELLDRLAIWGAANGASVRAYLDFIAQMDPLCVVEGHQPKGMDGLVLHSCTDLAGKPAADVLAMLDAGRVDEADLLTLGGFRPGYPTHSA